MNKIRRFVVYTILVVFAAAALGIGAAAVWHRLNQPYIMQMDCQGKGIDVERVKRWEEDGQCDSLEILRIAGWRTEEEQVVSSVSTGRKETTKVIGVYGSMELIEKAAIPCGRYGLAVEANYCVLSGKLARALFGGEDIAGEWVRVGKERLFVAGVIEKEEAVLLMPVKEGKLEMLAAELNGRIRAKERFGRLFGE